MHSGPADLLEELAWRGKFLLKIEEGVSNKRILMEELDISRSTVNRGMNEIKEAGLVEENDPFKLTNYGRLSLQLYSNANKAVEAFPFLPQLPTDIPSNVIYESTEIIEAESPFPQRPVEKITSSIASTDNLQFMDSVLNPRIIRAITKRIRNNDVQISIIISDEVFSAFETTYKDELDEFLNSESCVLSKTDRNMPVGLYLFDNARVYTAVRDQKGRLLGTILNETSPIVTWALNFFYDYSESSEDIFTRRSSPYRVHRL